jgi:hypothetical protein
LAFCRGLAVVFFVLVVFTVPDFGTFLESLFRIAISRENTVSSIVPLCLECQHDR